jgi:hypothetical protein
MKKTLVVLAILALVLWSITRVRASWRPVCPRGYYLIPGPNSFAGNPRVCVPIGESSSEDAIPAVYMQSF